MRIREIQIKNYRAFYGSTLTVSLLKSDEIKSANLIVYGENGSGKTSLFTAIKEFFSNISGNLNIAEYPRRNFFIENKIVPEISEREAKKLSEIFIKMKFESDTLTASKKLNYEWSNKTNEVSKLSDHGLDITKGFIDYKGLLETYFFQVNENKINAFKFLVDEVLQDAKQLGGRQTFGKAWDEINNLVRLLNEDLAKDVSKMSKREKDFLTISIRDGRATIRALLTNFNSQLTTFLTKLTEITNDLLSSFRQNISVEIDYAQARFEVSKENPIKEEIVAKNIDLEVLFYGKKREKHHQFLNEARLSAVAISLYLASFLVNPQAGIKILALDDVLIGLDMTNRLPVLDILEEYFYDYQIFLFTFDKFWYQALQHRFPHWKTLEFYTQKEKDFEMTFAKEKNSLMQKAQEQMKEHNYESAANLIRSNYEMIIKDFCSHLNLRVPFNSEMKKLNASIFWKVICDKKQRLGLSESIICRVDTVVKSILNPLSHAANIPITNADLMTAKTIIEDLEKELNRLKVGFSAKDFLN